MIKKQPVASYLTSLQYARIKRDLRNAAEASTQAVGGDVSRISIAPIGSRDILVTYFFFSAGPEALAWERVRISSDGNEATVDAFHPAALGLDWTKFCDAHNGQPVFKP